jgi:integrase/recombinase XerD
MTDKNKKLTDFGNGSDEKLAESFSNKEKSEDKRENDQNKKVETEDNLDDSTVCSCYQEMKIKHQETIDELGITPPKCGHCIAYLCNELRAGTAQAYNSPLRFFIESIHQQGFCISDVEFIDVRDYLEDRGKHGLSESTINVHKAAIKGVMSRFEAENKKFPEVAWKISNNIDPCSIGTGSNFERNGLKNKEIKLLLTELDDLRNKLMVLTNIETGPRADATTLIKVSDVNLEKKEIKLKNTKSGGTYVIPLTDELVALLEHWIRNVRSSYILDENNTYLFPSRKSGKITPSTYNRIVHTAAKEAGIQEKIGKIPITGNQKEILDSDRNYRTKWKVDAHSLRHTFSRLLKDNDVKKDTRTYALDHSRDVTDEYGIDEEASRKEIREKFDGIGISIL